MSASEFVQSLLGKNKKRDKVYLKKNEEWQDSLARIMLTGILKNQYYRSADDAAKEALPLMLNAAKSDPDFLLKAAVFARDANMKGMVKVGLAAIACSADRRFLDKKETRLVAIGLLSTFHPGQLLQFVELCKSKKLGRGFGSRQQKWVRAVMEGWNIDALENYTLKYPSALNALVRLVHPRYTDKRGPIVGYVLANGKAAGSKQKAVEKMKKETDPKKLATSMLKHSIPWDVVKGFAGMSDTHVCMAMMTQMGLSALLLNMRSLEEHGVFKSVNGIKALELKLGEVKNGRSIPIDFAKPYIHCSSAKVKKHLVSAMADTLSVPMPHIEGKRIGVSVDISGSMRGEPLLTAGLLAVPFLKAKSLWFTTFDTQIYEEGTSHCPAISNNPPTTQVDNLLKLHTYGGTDVAISLRNAIKYKRKLDLMVLITDEQQNAGTPLRRVWADYKREINPDAELWVINASNYQWHSADFEDPSITVYQTMTPAIFKNLQFVGIDLVSSIHNYDLTKTMERAEKSM